MSVTPPGVINTLVSCTPTSLITSTSPTTHDFTSSSCSKSHQRVPADIPWPVDLLPRRLSWTSTCYNLLPCSTCVMGELRIGIGESGRAVAVRTSAIGATCVQTAVWQLGGSDSVIYHIFDTTKSH